jgi:hypothetical protein
MAADSTPHPPGPRRRRRSTDATRSQRNRAIVAARAAGTTWREIEAEFGLSTRQCRQVVADARAATDGSIPALDVDPDAVLARVVADHEWAAERLRRLAEKADNDSAKVGAAKGCAAVGRDLVALLVGVGIAPRRVEWRNFRDAKTLAEAMMRQLVEALGEEAAIEWTKQLPRNEPVLPEVRLEAAA